MPVERPVMGHRWDMLTFLHWRYEPTVVQALSVIPAPSSAESTTPRTAARVIILGAVILS